MYHRHTCRTRNGAPCLRLPSQDQLTKTLPQQVSEQASCRQGGGDRAARAPKAALTRPPRPPLMQQRIRVVQQQGDLGKTTLRVGTEAGGLKRDRRMVHGIPEMVVMYVRIM